MGKSSSFTWALILQILSYTLQDAGADPLHHCSLGTFQLQLETSEETDRQPVKSSTEHRTEETELTDSGEHLNEDKLI